MNRKPTFPVCGAESLPLLFGTDTDRIDVPYYCRRGYVDAFRLYKLPHSHVWMRCVTSVALVHERSQHVLLMIDTRRSSLRSNCVACSVDLGVFPLSSLIFYFKILIDNRVNEQ